MKKVECSNPKCSERRIHWERPFENRPQQIIEVEDDFEGKAYCSMTCWAEGEKRNVWTGEKIEDTNGNN